LDILLGGRDAKRSRRKRNEVADVCHHGSAPAIVISARIDPGAFKKNLDRTSVLRFLAERFTPGRDYSPEVAARHAATGAALRSLGDVANRAIARDVPGPPNLGPFKTVSMPSGRLAVTPGQQGFSPLEPRRISITPRYLQRIPIASLCRDDP
jgi:hypothetical protein